MKTLSLPLLCISLLPMLSGCARPLALSPATQKTTEAPAENLTLKTADDWNLHAELYRPRSANGTGVVLLHQRGGEASDWKSLCLALQKAGDFALAIDERGAGQSQRGSEESGDNAPWDTRNDIGAALAKLKSLGAKRIVLIGASYGANNALRFASEKPVGITAVVLFSPGEDYHGLKALDAAKKSHAPLLIFTAKQDGISGSGPRKIKTVSGSSRAKLIELDGSAHGTDLLSAGTISTTLDFVRGTASN